jgi:hypothetical protein
VTDERHSIRLPASLDRRRLIYRWDLDKTYLRTEFDTMRDLVRTAFEPATAKRTVPGAAVLLREICRTGPAGVTILSGSPEQMRRVLEKKLRLDGIQWSSFTLKPSLHNLLRGRFRFVRDQLGYKLAALLASRVLTDVANDEVCFGDDAEADAFIYSLYADLCAGRVSQDLLLELFTTARTYPVEVPRLLRLAAEIPKRESLRHIFIHLDRVSAPEDFAALGTRVCPFFNYLQPALVLLEGGGIDAASAFRVAAELVVDHAFTSDGLVASYADLVRRKHLGAGAALTLAEAAPMLTREKFATAAPVLRAFVTELEKRLPSFPEAPGVVVEPIDYVRFFASDRERAHAAKRRASPRRKG